MLISKKPCTRNARSSTGLGGRMWRCETLYLSCTLFCNSEEKWKARVCPPPLSPFSECLHFWATDGNQNWEGDCFWRSFTHANVLLVVVEVEKWPVSVSDQTFFRLKCRVIVLPDKWLINYFSILVRIRCKIYFYLEDDSIQVIEPKVENSGIPQGKFCTDTCVQFLLINQQSWTNSINWLDSTSYKWCVLLLTGTLIRRHRIPLPSPNDEEFYTVENFNIGQEITLYSRTFKITVSITSKRLLQTMEI